jgi:hypothetical protein
MPSAGTQTMATVYLWSALFVHTTQITALSTNFVMRLQWKNVPVIRCHESPAQGI